MATAASQMNRAARMLRRIGAGNRAQGRRTGSTASETNRGPAVTTSGDVLRQQRGGLAR